MIDTQDPRTRVLECTSCGEPVSGIETAGRVSLVCGYCDATDERELAIARASAEATDGPYRGRARTAGGKPLPCDLTQPLKGIERAWLRPSGLPKLRAALAAAKKDLGSAPEDEFRVLWLSAVIANLHLRRGDPIRARATLETALELVSVPAYRVMVLARLARVAATEGATALAEKWLKLAPPNTRVVEAESDLAVADAFLARARKKPEDVLSAIGTRRTESDFVGPARALAIALRADAHEQLGQRAEAYAVWLAGKQPYASAVPLGLCPETRAAAQVLAWIAIVAVLTTVGGFIWSLWSALEGDMTRLACTLGASVLLWVVFRVAKGVLLRRRPAAARAA